MEKEAERRDRFSGLLELHRKIVFKVINTYCRQPQDRDDLAQEITYQLWRAFPAYDTSRTFSTWMYRIALNVAISYVRRTRRRQVVSMDSELDGIVDNSTDDPEANEQVRELYRFIDQLDPLNRALLLLYLEEHRYSEIAEILGITETNVATKISRLKQRLTDELNPTDQEH